MFVENKKYEPFGLEIKRCCKELSSIMSTIWEDYDYEMGIGDPYYSPCFSKEKIIEMNENVDKKIKQAIMEVADSFKFKEYSFFIQDFLSCFSRTFKEIRSFPSIFDYSVGGRLENPIDFHYMGCTAHQCKTNIVISSLAIENNGDNREILTKYVLDNYKEILDEQAEAIENQDHNCKDKPEVIWDNIVLILFDQNNLPSSVELYDVIVRKY